MPSFALLTRILLCLCLLLNGSTAAALPMMQALADAQRAEAAMPVARAAASAHPARHALHPHAPAAATATTPCHAAPTADDHDHDRAGGKHGCCASAAHCPCPHLQPLLAFPALPIALPALSGSLVPGGQQEERGLPGRSRLDRPPIA